MRIRLPHGASANVSEDIRPETVNALDEMMEAVRHIPSVIRRCVSCQHSRSKHKHKQGTSYNYGSCRSLGCLCIKYQDQ